MHRRGRALSARPRITAALLAGWPAVTFAVAAEPRLPQRPAQPGATCAAAPASRNAPLSALPATPIPATTSPAPLPTAPASYSLRPPRCIQLPHTTQPANPTAGVSPRRVSPCTAADTRTVSVRLARMCAASYSTGPPACGSPAIQTVLALTNERGPKGPSSRPYPEFLIPPKGTAGVDSVILFR